MANRIMDEIRDSFREGSVLTKLIYINLGVFFIVKIAFVAFFLFVSGSNGIMGKEAFFNSEVLSYLMVQSNLELLLSRPWTPFTYMFLHFGFLHILFNLIVLYWFGRIYLQYLNGKQLLTTYILGGLSGAILFIAAYNLFPGLTDAQALGASAAVMAVVLAISFYTPDYTVLIPFIGSVKIKYIAMVYVALDVLQIASENSGGHIAHLGGALYGYLFAMQMRRGKDIGRGFSTLSDSLVSIFSRKSKLRVTHKSKARVMDDFDYNKSKSEAQKEVDKVLDKIAKSGYNSLSKGEKELLFKMSGKK